MGVGSEWSGEACEHCRNWLACERVIVWPKEINSSCHVNALLLEAVHIILR